MKKHSQNGEDVYIWNYIQKHGLEVEPYFIELGACDGKLRSNCRLFAEQGWGGVCIEANPEYFAKLFKLYMDSEIETINAAILPSILEKGVVPFRIYPSHVDHSGIHKYPKFDECVTVEVDAIYYEDLPKHPIGLISIDLEGIDTAVLTDILLSEHKPEFVIIESNNMEERRHQVDLLNIDYDIINILDVNTIWHRREQ